MSIKIFGIKNCDTVKKALRWLEAQGIAAQLHDFRSDGLPRDMLQNWVNTCGLAALVNKRSTTYRQLTDEQRSILGEEQAGALEILLEQPTLIKRPVLPMDSHIEIGFKADSYHTLFNKGSV